MQFKVLLPAVISLVVFVGLFYLFTQVFPRPSIPRVQLPPKSPESQSQKEEVLAKNQNAPWALAFLPNGDLSFTQRSGELMLLEKGKREPVQISKIDEVKQGGEGGLLGFAVSPNFQSNKYIFVYYTYSSNGNDTKNRVVRYKFNDGQLTDRTVIVDAIPGAIFHNGGRIKFGPDGFLYITCGDSLEPSLAQDTNSLAGKILRVDEDGGAADGNPLDSRIYSYGHRNPQGLAWDDQGRLWETEHGQSAQDEVNLIQSGKNYGWPDIRGNAQREGMESPYLQSGSVTWAPSGTAFLDGYLYFAGLRGEGLFRLSAGDAKDFKKVIGDLGRIRDVVVGPDNLLYIATGNTDGRGSPGPDDDKIIILDPKSF